MSSNARLHFTRGVVSFQGSVCALKSKGEVRGEYGEKKEANGNLHLVMCISLHICPD